LLLSSRRKKGKKGETGGGPLKEKKKRKKKKKTGRRKREIFIPSPLLSRNETNKRGEERTSCSQRTGEKREKQRTRVSPTASLHHPYPSLRLRQRCRRGEKGKREEKKVATYH